MGPTYRAAMRISAALFSRASLRARLRQQHLKELRRFSESLVEDAPFSILTLDSDGTILSMNQAAQRLTLYTSEELVGKTALVLHDPAEVQRRAEALAQEQGRPVAAGFETFLASFGRRRSHESNWEYVRRDGSRVAVHVTVVKIPGPKERTSGYLAIAFDISERKALAESITFFAHHDPLTKLPNRSQLAEFVRRAIDEAVYLNRRVALFVIDIDHFKRVNDSLGHDTGDRLLMKVAQVLKQSIRASDVLARLGGDEFIVLLSDAGERADIARCGERLAEAMRQPFEIAGRRVTLTASIGACTFPDLGQDFDSLLRNADTAMYAAKHRGRNRFQEFVEEMRKTTTDRLELEGDLRKAIEEGQFTLHYQPQVDTQTKDLTGVEALLRWNHPVRGFVPPTEFIRAAEECGVIISIGEWVIRQACREARLLQIKLGRRFTLAVNISPHQVLQDNLFDVIRSALRDSGLAPEDLELEITENTLMISTQETTAMLTKIRDLGVKLAVDDFGTGFSNFRYILEQKIDRLKIDRSFVAKCASDATSAAVVRTIIAMAHGLNISVVAEGVETCEQSAFLQRRRCDVLQGFLFGKPEAIDKLEHLGQPDEHAVASLQPEAGTQ